MGMFSFLTHDTRRSIPIASKPGVRESARQTFTVYMKDDKGRVFQEDAYEGYGVFGGMDIFELLAKMNGLGSVRQAGIDLFYGKNYIGWVKYPTLTEDPTAEFDGDKKLEQCPHQGFLYDDDASIHVVDHEAVADKDDGTDMKPEVLAHIKKNIAKGGVCVMCSKPLPDDNIKLVVKIKSTKDILNIVMCVPCSTK